MVGQKRPGKRLREDEVESFFDGNAGRDGSYLRASLKGEKSFNGKGWPWIQAGIRNVIGQEKVEKANVLRDGCLLLKTKNKTQTEKLLKITTLMGDECEVKRDEKLNVSRGTIHAYDLFDLSEEDVVHWLSEFGVTHAKRFTRKVEGTVQKTPTILLTFAMPTCPNKIELDYMTYHVKRYIPNPLICYRCGKFGHPEVRCTNEPKCLTCGENKHNGECEEKCQNCSQLGHSCLSWKCAVWQREKDICTLKVEQEIPYGQARKLYENSQKPPTLKGYAEAVRLPSVSLQNDMEMKGKVEKLERKIDEMTNLLAQMAKKLNCDVQPVTDPEEQGENVPESETEKQPEKRDEGAQSGESNSQREEGKDLRGRKETSQVTEWKTVKSKNKGKGKEGKKNEMETENVNDVPGPSQVVGRNASERGSNRSGSITRKSWTNQ